ncbi:lipase family protein [Nocardia altamirensis]|uniref:lipase family protein n=1 Tax=Nocardia altamirensis TaxID=472158 RepID=UPI0009FDB6E3|nr:lipase family protein [Nocardia altamirensis]
MAGRVRRAVVVSAGLTAMVLVGSAANVPPVAVADDFAASPAAMSPGDILTSEPLQMALSVPVDPGSFPANAQRIVYRTTDAKGAPTTAIATVLSPILPWRGIGERPLVSFAVGTHGIASHCRTSELMQRVLTHRPPFDVSTEYEAVFLGAMLLRGIAVVVTDYIPSTYLITAAEGHAVIDAARAAQRLPDAGIPARGPIAFWGYSQGGHAVGAAAELAGSYAPELDLKGSYVGAPPVSHLNLFRYAEGGMSLGAGGFFLKSLISSYPELAAAVDEMLNDKGRQFLETTTAQCVGGAMLSYGFQPSDSLTKDGRPMAQALEADPRTAQVLEDMMLGGTGPTAPVLLSTGSNDDLVPPTDPRQLARTWCDKGATVDLVDLPLPMVLPGTIIGHTVNAPIVGFTEAQDWLNDRFNGIPAPSTCH